MNPIRLVSCLPTVWPNKIGLFPYDSLARHQLLLAYDWSIVAMGQIYLTDLAIDVSPVWDLTDKKNNRDLKPKRRDGTDKKLNITSTEITMYYNTK
jgi:hypothetical protein